MPEVEWSLSAQADLEAIAVDQVVDELRRIARTDLRLPVPPGRDEGSLERQGRRYWWRRGIPRTDSESFADGSLDDDWEPEDGHIGRRALDYYLIYRRPTVDEHRKAGAEGRSIEAVVVRVLDVMQIAERAPQALLEHRVAQPAVAQSRDDGTPLAELIEKLPASIRPLARHLELLPNPIQIVVDLLGRRR